MTNINSIFVASIVIYSSLIFGVFSEDVPDCDIDKVETDQAIIVKFTGDNIPTYFGDFPSIPNELLCKNGKVHMKFVNDVDSHRLKSFSIQNLFAPYSNMTAKELRLWALPRNLDRINVSHNSIEHILDGM